MNFKIPFVRVDRCERCGSTKDVILRNVFIVYPARMCLPCWREWELKMLNHYDSVIYKALDREYRENFDIISPKRKREIVTTNAEVLKNIYPTLVDFLVNHGKK